MESLQFEWDEAKAASNLKKHGVSFDLASGIFYDAFAVEAIDSTSDPAETRFILLGTAAGTVLVVVYCERSTKLRIISARKATLNEERNYYLSQTDR